jgi:O-acetyl-ADP-ribose deacetylase (regulator of RNase III)
MKLSVFLSGRVIVKVGDITMEAVDAIVNAANSTLLGGGGVDGAIHSAGGPAIYEECLKIRETQLPDGLPTGQAVITTAGNLPSRHVIHTVGPIYGTHRGKDDELLAAAYINSLSLAASHQLTSIAFPSISTGAYRFPKARAAEISSRAIAEILSASDSIAEVRLVFFHSRDAEIFLEHSAF